MGKEQLRRAGSKAGEHGDGPEGNTEREAAGVQGREWLTILS